MVQAPPSFRGSLDQFESFDNTSHIGTTFPDKAVQISKLLAADNSDELIRDLAKLVSHRGVVFFTDQDITIEQQKQLATRLGELSGKPATSKLHIHPISENTENPGVDNEISVITSRGGISRPRGNKAPLVTTRSSSGWHTDITFENVPSDYAILKMHTLPSNVGGDTLWASGYEAYDRLSPAYQKFLEGLTALHVGDEFINYSQRTGFKLNDRNRGSPENSGTNLSAVHPVIRTNPVTGFKALFVNGVFTKRIVELSPDESNNLLEYLRRHISENHDLQVRYRWKANDVAIWDNRSTFHTATNDYEELREGYRVVSIGERPFLDPNSKSRRATLGLEFNVVNPLPEGVEPTPSRIGSSVIIEQ